MTAYDVGFILGINVGFIDGDNVGLCVCPGIKGECVGWGVVGECVVGENVVGFEDG